jgi:transcriptional regulator
MARNIGRLVERLSQIEQQLQDAIEKNEEILKLLTTVASMMQITMDEGNPVQTQSSETYPIMQNNS